MPHKGQDFSSLEIRVANETLAINLVNENKGETLDINGYNATIDVEKN